MASLCCGVCCKKHNSVSNSGMSGRTRVDVLCCLIGDMNGTWTVKYLFELSAKVVFFGLAQLNVK